MTNHVHLLVETPQPNLGDGMQLLHGTYGSWFNNRHTVGGHVFQGRYGAKRIKDEVHLITVARYIDANPVEAGLAATPERWPWCSRGARPTPRWLADHRRRELLGL
jgi:REP element-mobilizing transposase RayT